MDVPPFMDRAVMGWMLGDDETGRSTPLKTKLPKGATERVTTHYDPLQLRRLAILIQEKAMPQCEIQPDYLRFALDRLLESPEAFASTVGVHEWEALEAQYEMQRSAQFIDEMKEFLRNTEQSLGALDDDDVAGRERLRKVAEKFLYGVADCPIARDIMKLFR